MHKNISKNVSKDMSGKYSPGLVSMCEKLDKAKQSAINAFITSSKRQIQKKQQIPLLTGFVINLLMKSKKPQKVDKKCFRDCCK